MGVLTIPLPFHGVLEGPTAITMVLRRALVCSVRSQLSVLTQTLPSRKMQQCSSSSEITGQNPLCKAMHRDRRTRGLHCYRGNKILNLLDSYTPWVGNLT